MAWRFRWPGTVLREHGILSMNRRNAEFILRRNPRRHYPLVDDKLRTKELAQSAGISVPELYGVIATEHDVPSFERITAGHQAFVVKPAQGSGGKGILVIRKRRRGGFVKASGDLVDADYVQHHISNILSGMFSLGGLPDRALIEYCVEFDQVFEHVTWQGVPDIRIIVYRGVPVAAMIRLPTRASDGKANLHQGAVGAGVDLATGRTIGGVYRNARVDVHPDTGASLLGLEIPGWSRLLVLAARCHDLVRLGYLGVDIVLDRHHGPMVLELNARPGLSIQLANDSGLLPRLAAVDALYSLPADPSERAALAARIAEGARRGPPPFAAASDEG